MSEGGSTAGAPRRREVFVTGATGYIGRAFVVALLERGHRVRALVREQSLARLPAGVLPVLGDALRAPSFAAAVRAHETVVHLVGTPHPNPRKAAEFERVDLASILATIEAAQAAGVSQVVYLSVAHPAPVMHAYIAVRRRGEQALAEAGFAATVLRPWYVLGEGHRWPVLLKPLYAIAQQVPALRATALRLGLVTLHEMVAALVDAVEHPLEAGTIRVVDVPAIRAIAGAACTE